MHKNKAIIANVRPTKLSSGTVILLLLAPFVVIFYLSFIFNSANIDNYNLWIAQVIADIISVVVLLSLWGNILLDVLTPNHHRMSISMADNFLNSNPSVDILVPVYGEPLAVIQKTIEAIVNIKYPHTTYVLDDGKSATVASLAKKLNIHYITRTTMKFAKSGNLNHGLLNCKGEFFAIFDADQVAQDTFLHETLPFMSDPEVAMVQTPQHFINEESFIASGTADAQEIFYKYVCPAKNISNSAFCVGTNVLFRRKAIDEIEGIASVNHSEDIWTSLLLHENGWKTVFLNKILALGQAPTTIGSFFKQQLRWARGGLSMFFFYNPLNSEKLHLDQKIQYASANFFYLVGFAMIVYIASPLIYLLFGIKAFHSDSAVVWLLHYLPYFVLYYSLTWLLLGRIRLSTISASLSSFYPYILALISIFFGISIKWTSTNTNDQTQDNFKWIWPHLLILSVTAVSLVIGWIDPVEKNTTMYNSIWSIINAYLIYLFITGEKRTTI